MTKKIMSILLCCLILGNLVLPVPAQEDLLPREKNLSITTAEEFLTFAENCRLDSYSENLTVTLEADLDLTGLPFEGIPIFKGTFQGNYHKISGFAITAAGTAQGFFRRVSPGARVENLNLSGSVFPVGSRNDVGGIAGINEGTITHCGFEGEVSGSSRVGGIAGYNMLLGIVDGCHTKGEVSGSHFAGGITGENQGTIRYCRNFALVNTTARENIVELSDISLDALVNSEAVNTVTDIGGIAGLSSGVIRSCENRANVGYRHMGYNIGGIAGTQAGFITDCKNYAQVHGRKEVGGIVGQMEPVTVVEFSIDALQILEEQLGVMSDLVNRASGNAQAGAGDITDQVAALQSQTESAREAVASLLPDPEDPHLPDADTIVAAKNALSAAFTAMPGTMDAIARETRSTVVSLGRDLQAISSQIGVMGQTIQEAGENLGGTITDMSDADNEEMRTGKVSFCRNEGEILGDLNVGGIAGAIAMENDLDILEDWSSQGANSLNFESQIRAVLTNCENTGSVSCGKQNAGGITGWQSLGLVTDCLNIGSVGGSGCQQVGGIVGAGSGYIRRSSARCAVTGSAFLGGIAGSASIVTDCRSLTAISGTGENIGAILGSREEPLTHQERPLAGNFYLAADRDPGAIDGISYEGLAQPLKLGEFLALEDLPEAMGKVTVSFLYYDGSRESLELSLGQRLNRDRIPEVPAWPGHSGQWEGLRETDLSAIRFDTEFKAVYTAYAAVVAGTETRAETGLPLMLVQGSFTPDFTLAAEASPLLPPLAPKEGFLESWQLQMSEQVQAIRFQLPKDADFGELKLMVKTADTDWTEVPFRTEKRYAVFDAPGRELTLAIVQRAPDYTMWYVSAAALVLLVLILVIAVVSARKRKAGKAAAEAPKNA